MIPVRDNIPTKRFPVVTVALIAINAAVWLLYELPDLNKAVVESGWIPCEVNGVCDPPGPSWPVDAVTSMFMHGSWIHIIGNMLFLWIFGNNIEDRLGRLWFVVFYFAAGFAATALQTFITLRFGTVEDSFVPNVGASGAIAGVLGAYFLLYPHARVLSFVILVVVLVPIEVPAMVFLGIWFLFQLWQGGFDLLAPTGSGAGGVAFFAHIGGFLLGVIVGLVLRGRDRPRAPAWPRSEL